MVTSSLLKRDVRLNGLRGSIFSSAMGCEAPETSALAVIPAIAARCMNVRRFGIVRLLFLFFYGMCEVKVALPYK
jgi:hypothetical protein